MNNPAQTNAASVAYSAGTPGDPASPVGSSQPSVSQDDRIKLFDQILDEVQYASTDDVNAPTVPTIFPQNPPVAQQPVVQQPATLSQQPPTNPPVSQQQPPPQATQQVRAAMAGMQTGVAPQDQQAEYNLADSVLPQAWPSAVGAATDTLNPQAAGARTTKEQIQASGVSPAEAAAGVQVVEYERTPELPVEVEGYLSRVEDHQELAPQEVVIADGTEESAQAAYPSRPVVVLPITEEIEEQGKKKSPKFSIRWLVEWSHKIIKMFAGKVIYRQTEGAGQ